MKLELGPRYTQKIGNNYVLWFEVSNSYSVISTSSYRYLIAYLAAKNDDDFIKTLSKDASITPKELIDISREFPIFLEAMNSALPSSEPHAAFVNIPVPKITKHYDFGGSVITINYSSEKVLQLIHPQLQHGAVDKNTDVNVIFDIFVDNSLLYLFKNRSVIGSYDPKEFHFLQGKFAMQLLDALYHTKESDWLATFHASTICNDQEAIMVIGDSGNGKSTLSALLMSHRWDLLADDFTPMLAETQHLYRFPAAISVKKGAFDMIDKLFKGFDTLEASINTSKQMTVKYLPPSKPFKTSQKSFPCHKIVRVKYSADGNSQLNEIPSEELLQTLIPDTWISPKADHSKQFLNWLSNLSFYELTYSTNEFAIAKFGELFKL